MIPACRATIPAAMLAAAFFAPGAGATVPQCGPGDEIIITGIVGKDLEGQFVLEPFEVLEGVNELSVAAEQAASFTPPATPAGQIRNTLDFGTRGPGPDAFRGWNHPRSTFSAASATRSVHRGPIEPGTWYVEVGVAAIVEETTSDYDVTIICRRLDPLPDEVPWATLRDPALPVPAKTGPGWYAGDLHVHSLDSSDSPSPENLPGRPNGATVDAIAEFATAVARLDFFSLTDHNTDGHLDDLGERQSDWAARGLLIIPGTEVTTYRGHANWHGGFLPADERFVEYRTGAVWIRNPEDGSLSLHAPARNGDRILADAREKGALTQVNHPTQFNDLVSSNLCRGCAWDYPDTDWSLVDLFEVQTAPPGFNQIPDQTVLGPNPFTITALLLWERLLLEGHRITAIGTSDDHRAGSSPSFTQSPIGTPATVVFAEELSESAILAALKAGHAYIRFWGPEGPHVELFVRDDPSVIMGDSFEADATVLVAKVAGGPAGQIMRIVHNSVIVAAVPVVPDADGQFVLEFPATGTGFWRIETLVGTSWQAMTNPIFLTLPAN